MKTTHTPESLAAEMDEIAAYLSPGAPALELRHIAEAVRALAAAPVAEAPVGRDAALQLAQAAIVAASLRGEGMRALNQHRMNCGHSVAYVDEAFENVAADLEAKVGALLGEPPAAPAAADAELVALQEALTFIRDNKHCAYDENASDSYGTGVTDGHRYCANVARAALMGLPNPYTAPDFKKAMDALYASREVTR